MLSLPEELISNICERCRENLPSVRLVSRQLQHASLHVFLNHYFEECPVLAHPASFIVLRDVLKVEAFRLAIKRLRITTELAFPSRFDHDALIKDGIIRKALGYALPKIPFCRSITASYFVGNAGALGRSQVKAWGGFDTFCVDHNGHMLSVSDQGYEYRSYVYCDILEVLSRLGHSVHIADLSCGGLEHLPLADFIDMNVIAGRRQPQLTELSLDVTDQNDSCSLARRAKEEPELATADALRSLFSCFPSLQKLSMTNWKCKENVFFPTSLPLKLKELKYEEVHDTVTTTPTLNVCLSELQNLERLIMGDVTFGSVDQCAELLRTVARLPSLVQFRMDPKIERDVEEDDGKPLCYQTCRVLGFERSWTGHEYRSTAVQDDLPRWADNVHVCTCDEDETDFTSLDAMFSDSE